MRTRPALALAAITLLTAPTIGRAQATGAPPSATGGPADPSRAKVYSINMIALKPGVTGEQFERFFAERLYPNWKVPGATMRLVKGDRVDRTGRYLVIFEIESRALRDRWFPRPDSVPSAEWQRVSKPLEPILAEWARLASAPGVDMIYTDYEVVGTPPRATPAP